MIARAENYSQRPRLKGDRRQYLSGNKSLNLVYGQLGYIFRNGTRSRQGTMCQYGIPANCHSRPGFKLDF